MINYSDEIDVEADKLILGGKKNRLKHYLLL
jgi:hypothetical protein